MSHFVVAVVTKTLGKKELAAVLQPYHEFESTGVDDEYVKDIDLTKEALTEYAEATVTRLRDPQGNLHSFFDDKGEWRPEFSQPEKEPLFPGSTRRERFVPPGYTEVEVLASTIESAAEWISENHGWGIVGKSKDEDLKYGYIELNPDGSVAKCIDRTNQSKKWDWWQIGGRYSAMLLNNIGKKVNQARKSDIDFAKMRADDEAKAASEYDEAIKVIDGRPIPHWKNVLALFELAGRTIEEARTEYHSDPVVVDWKKAYPDNFFGPNPSDYDMPREKFIEQAGDNSFHGFAVLDANGWHEKGRMGWWGMVSDEQEEESWGKQKQAILATIPDDHFITMVDCHI